MTLEPDFLNKKYVKHVLVVFEDFIIQQDVIAMTSNPNLSSVDIYNIHMQAYLAPLDEWITLPHMEDDEEEGFSIPTLRGRIFNFFCKVLGKSSNV